MTTPTQEAYEELQYAFDHYNRELFSNELPPCLITLQREKRTYGYFSSKRFVNLRDEKHTDEIAMNPAYFAVISLQEILQTLVHEMVHAWQFHFGKPGRRGYHNREWADKMESVGLMPSSTSAPGGARTGEKMGDYALESGQFLAATEKLLGQGFGISWLDRLPVAVSETVTPTTASGAALGAPLGAGLSGLIHSPVDINRSNRIKYRCPSCASQAWGKPNLRLLCGETACDAAPLLPVDG
ncbi:SprT-like domain-containing protein [Pseudovibrio brasiliensis]|uniref:SprT-like domain-containing protein n=1 Tax=Pseudovibrio brasiliensis TaxID=1898042 RepID=A0ABX8AVU7_9HYPH|nr:SprT-like domain-containing protein [Pseudovibrio brasiliensis]QUS59174.1 SprT-like domain-containing protein [Pseudovibrio brasiliensis]